MKHVLVQIEKVVVVNGDLQAAPSRVADYIKSRSWIAHLDLLRLKRQRPSRRVAFDLGQDRLPNFAAYRFLYERLIGASARPWLPAAFCSAAALPHLHPDRRRLLLQSISESAATAPGWSNREPAFWPEWVEKVDQQQAA